jgi:ribonuclease P protein component
VSQAVLRGTRIELADRGCVALYSLPRGVGEFCAPSVGNPALWPGRRPSGGDEDLASQYREIHREQAYFPAEQPPPFADPRVPAAHAHPGRAGDHRCSPRQGSQAPVCLTCVLPASARLTGSDDFRLVTRKGRRAGRPRLVVHVITAEEVARAGVAASASTRIGFVVSKTVGNSVVRHRVTRRLRHLFRDRLGTVPPGCALVVRALPPAAEATSAELGKDIDSALRRLRLAVGDGGVQ